MINDNLRMESPTGIIMDEYDEQHEQECAPTNKFQPIYKRQAKPNNLRNLKWKSPKDVKLYQPQKRRLFNYVDEGKNNSLSDVME